ncbi:MAG TPA: hypothetical protein VMR31_10005 [Myxococcota bacterium]|nr:hypothetical protein [Myxococcota bacterium]
MSEDERWIEAVRREFVPDTLRPERAAELRRELARRIAADEPRRRFALPALAGAVVAALALWLAAPVRIATNRDASVTGAEIDAYVDPDAVASEISERPDYLPADYENLALLLDDDAAER